jgi:hypothetical protein
MKDTQRRMRSLPELPQSLEPTRDLWPQIEAQIRAPPQSSEARTPARPRARGLPSWRFAAAAALGFMACALAAGLWWLHAGGASPLSTHAAGAGVVAQGGGQPASGAIPVSARDEAARRAALLRSLDARLQALPAPTQQKVRADLQVIEKSIQDIQAALGRDPGNALLHEMLRETEQDEQHLASTVQEAGVWTQEASGGQGRVGS